MDNCPKRAFGTRTMEGRPPSRIHSSFSRTSQEREGDKERGFFARVHYSDWYGARKHTFIDCRAALASSSEVRAAAGQKECDIKQFYECPPWGNAQLIFSADDLFVFPFNFPVISSSVRRRPWTKPFRHFFLSSLYSDNRLLPCSTPCNRRDFSPNPFLPTSTTTT
jgi:hypothetical protein